MYRHTQTALPIWISGVVAMILIAFIAGGGAAAGIAIIVALVILAAGLIFSRLTVVVDDTEVTATFGWGWPRREITLGDIAAAEAVRNKWWYGWGIRGVPGGWMYNVWGLDAVDLVLAEGNRFRIGTDEPATLLAAIERDRTG